MTTTESEQQQQQQQQQPNQNGTTTTSTTPTTTTIPAAIPHVAKVYDAKPSSLNMSMEEYRAKYAASIADAPKFWAEQANVWLDWFTPPPTDKPALSGGFAQGDVAWFAGGKLNVCYNAMDRHVSNNNNTTTSNKADQLAMVWEGDEPTSIRKITYRDLLRKTCQIANALQSVGVSKGDVVTVYMPMIPELAMTMLACARLGAIHSVVFAGFSAEALAQRVSAAQSKFVVTAHQGKRGGKVIPLKDIVNDALSKLDCASVVQHVLVWEHMYDAATANPDQAPYPMQPKDIRMDLLVALQRPYSVPAVMDAEDAFFILYTSGSTGKPKGLLHTTGGYALYAAMTTATTFALTPTDLFACVADCGWITGHTYVVYGPLLNGSTTFLFESTPVYPCPGRYWDMVQRHQITKFYTAPTAIRLLMRFGDAIPAEYDTSSLQVLGTVGEPINPEAWRWYYQVVGKSKCTVVDTYWQTETGGHVITNLPGVTPMKPGSCTLPFFGIDTVVLDPLTGKEVEIDTAAATKDGSHAIMVEGVLAIRQPWPGMARTCLGDHPRYLQTYLTPYPGYYFTGDSVHRDADGFHFIIGRVDDVLNVSGHRIGTAEVESALVEHPAVAQAAVVGQPHDIKGQSICAFCMLTCGYNDDDENSHHNSELAQELKHLVRTEIGAFCTPDLIVLAPSLPMTRSGKIMRRILRKIVCNEIDTLGDISTLADPSIVEILIEKVQALTTKTTTKTNT